MFGDDVFESVEDRFKFCVKRSARLERLFTGCRWAEGPAYFPAGRYLVWSDIPNDRMLRWDETTGTVGVFRHPAGYSNGNTVDRRAGSSAASTATAASRRTEHDGSITVIADRYDGKRLNSPNDVVVKIGRVDLVHRPGLRHRQRLRGHKAESEIGACHVYRVDPGRGDCRIVADDFVRPNGLAFSPDERRLYVADTGASQSTDGPRHIRVFDVDDDGRLSGGEVFAECTGGALRRLPRSTTTAASGRAPARRRTATTPTAR